MEKQGKMILIGSAHADVREVCRGLLMQAGYEVLPALHSDGEVLRALQSQTPDLLLLDYCLDGRNGLLVSEVVDRIPVVVMLPPKQMGMIPWEDGGRPNRYFVGLDFSRRAILQTVAFALETESRIRALEAQMQELYRQIRNKRDINVAKGLLMEQLQLPEKDAHRMLQKSSMDKSMPVCDLVQDILDRERSGKKDGKVDD